MPRAAGPGSCGGEAWGEAERPIWGADSQQQTSIQLIPTATMRPSRPFNVPPLKFRFAPKADVDQCLGPAR